MEYYLIESYASWLIVKAKNARSARTEGVREYGRGYVKTVRLAEPDEVEYFRNLKGEPREAGDR